MLEPGLPRPTAPDRARVADLILQAARRRGLRSVTVGTLLAQGAPLRVRWFR